jgi:hypothetical protein
MEASGRWQRSAGLSPAFVRVFQEVAGRGKAFLLESLDKFRAIPAIPNGAAARNPDGFDGPIEFLESRRLFVKIAALAVALVWLIAAGTSAWTSPLPSELRPRWPMGRRYRTPALAAAAGSMLLSRAAAPTRTSASSHFSRAMRTGTTMSLLSGSMRDKDTAAAKPM